jgi:NAD-dependent dihydropyrimidine dehydrogenase PreA subunit/flavodoxin
MVFYFSGTGNSLYIAERIAKEEHTSIVSIAGALRRDERTFTIGDEEKIGFVFPTYFFGIPTIVSEFISKLRLTGNPRPYIYLVLTCGDQAGNADVMFARKLKKKGYSLSASFAVPMVDNYILLYKVAPLDKQRKRLDAADEVLDGICRGIGASLDGDLIECRGAFPALVTFFLYPFYGYGRRTAKFHVTANCTACGLCERICPGSAISMADGKPRWGKTRCVHCLGCINRCPTRAIEYGKATDHTGRYVNPRVTF